MHTLPSPCLRLVPTAPHIVPAPLLGVDWRRLLTDLTSFGPMRFAAGNGWADLQAVGEPWSARGEPPVMRLSGPGIDLVALTGRWASAELGRAAGSAHRLGTLTVHDHRRAALLTVALPDTDEGRGFHARLAHQWARPAAPLPVPQTKLGPAERAGLVERGTHWPDERSPSPSVIPVDPTLLPPFLETMADQACPLQLVVANSGLRMAHADSFHAMQHRHDRLCLRSRTARLDLDLGGVAHARVDGSTLTSSVQLYGDDRRCGLTLALGARADRHQCALWCAMLRALSD